MFAVLFASFVQLGATSVQNSNVAKNFTGYKFPGSVRILQDDILLPPNYDEGWRTKLIETDVPQLWPGGVVNYIFKENEVDQQRRDLIRAALRDIEQHSCVRFRESASHGPYLLVRNIGEGCASVIGYHKEVKYVDLYLSGDRCYTRGSIQHEFLHSLGFGHEHTRPDRDSYVTIQWSSIEPGAEINFKKRRVRWATDQLPYDYESVMHYRPDAFHRGNSSLTVVPRQPGAILLTGQRLRLSKLDTDKLNLLYSCHRPAAAAGLPFRIPKICFVPKTTQKMKFLCNKLGMMENKYFGSRYY